MAPCFCKRFTLRALTCELLKALGPPAQLLNSAKDRLVEVIGVRSQEWPLHGQQLREHAEGRQLELHPGRGLHIVAPLLVLLAFVVFQGPLELREGLDSL